MEKTVQTRRAYQAPQIFVIGAISSETKTKVPGAGDQWFWTDSCIPDGTYENCENTSA